MPRQPEPCPSRAAYARHIRNGETPCPGDVEEYNRYQRERYAVRNPEAKRTRRP